MVFFSCQIIDVLDILGRMKLNMYFTKLQWGTIEIDAETATPTPPPPPNETMRSRWPI